MTYDTVTDTNPGKQSESMMLLFEVQIAFYINSLACVTDLFDHLF